MTSSNSRPPLTVVAPGIHCAADYEHTATAYLDEVTLAHLAGGSERDVTLARNRAAFDAYAIWPRLLRDVTAGHTRVRLNGRELAHPILLAPVAFQRSFHPGAELETARAAAATDSVLVLSTRSSVTLEDVAQVAGPRWFQLYLQPTRDTSLDLVARAARAGYAAIVVTLDAPLQPASHRALRAGPRNPADLVPANLAKYPVVAQDHARGANRILNGLMAHAPTWDDLAWLADHCPLPLRLKGVLHPDDARRVASLDGVAGIVVSNHGGRSLDGAPASLAALPLVRAAVPPAFPLLIDGGIRSGSDIFKALALGADAVLVGRLQAHALAVAGALGVAHMMKLLREELETCMALAGCADLAAIGSDAVALVDRGTLTLNISRPGRTPC